MLISGSRNIIFGILLCLSLLLLPLIATAQERDTTGVELEQESDRTILMNRQFDRSMTGGSMTEMGTHTIPREQQFYQRPFKGQQHLDEAMEAYRDQLTEPAGDDWYWQFLRAVSPYINLRLSAFETMEMQYIDRDNPLFESYKEDEIE